MAKLFLVVLMAAVQAVLVHCCPATVDEKDSGEPVSYNGTIVSLTMKKPRVDNQTLPLHETALVQGCVRASIVRTSDHVQVSVASCYGSKFDYDRELTDALGLLHTASLGISERDVGLIRFTECTIGGGTLYFDVRIQQACLTAGIGTGPCQVIASGRKELGAPFGMSYDARDLLPKGGGTVIAGQGALLVGGLMVMIVGTIDFGGY